MLSPLPRRSDWAYCFAHFTQPCQPSPIWQSGRPAHCPFRGLLGVHSRYGLHTRAVTVFRDTLSEGFSHFVTSMSCSGCFRLERLPGGICTHWKAPPFHGARHQQTLTHLRLVRAYWSGTVTRGSSARIEVFNWAGSTFLRCAHSRRLAGRYVDQPANAETRWRRSSR